MSVSFSQMEHTWIYILLLLFNFLTDASSKSVHHFVKNFLTNGSSRISKLYILEGPTHTSQITEYELYHLFYFKKSNRFFKFIIIFSTLPSNINKNNLLCKYELCIQINF